MTRETKVGLVVASSFLCLVGIVLASKLQEDNNVQAETAQAPPSRTPPPTAIHRRTAPAVGPRRPAARDAVRSASASPRRKPMKTVPIRQVPYFKPAPGESGAPIMLASGKKTEENTPRGDESGKEDSEEKTGRRGSKDQDSHDSKDQDKEVKDRDSPPPPAGGALPPAADSRRPSAATPTSPGSSPVRNKAKEAGEKVNDFPPPAAGVVPPPAAESGEKSPVTPDHSATPPVKKDEKKDDPASQDKVEPSTKTEAPLATEKAKTVEAGKEPQPTAEDKQVADLAELKAKQEKQAQESPEKKESAEHKESAPAPVKEAHPSDETKKDSAVPVATVADVHTTPVAGHSGEPATDKAALPVKEGESQHQNETDKPAPDLQPATEDARVVRPVKNASPDGDHSPIGPVAAVPTVGAKAVASPVPAAEAKEPVPALASNPDAKIPQAIAVPLAPASAEQDKRPASAEGSNSRPVIGAAPDTTPSLNVKIPAKAAGPSDHTAPSSLPPLGAPANVGGPPIAVPVSPAAGSSGTRIVPRVESFVVESYQARPADSFASISKSYYHSEKYEQALLQFNREHHLAGPAVLRDPPALEAGQSVFIPPVDVLENRYGSLVPGHKPVQLNPPVVAASGPVTAGQVAEEKASPAAAAVVPVAAWSTPPATRLYRVQGPGERLYDIARRDLGNGARWNEIYRLNPQIDPAVAVPGGTMLRLPADARVDRSATH